MITIRGLPQWQPLITDNMEQQRREKGRNLASKVLTRLLLILLTENHQDVKFRFISSAGFKAVQIDDLKQTTKASFFHNFHAVVLSIIQPESNKNLHLTCWRQICKNKQELDTATVLGFTNKETQQKTFKPKTYLDFCDEKMLKKVPQPDQAAPPVFLCGSFTQL